ncbi:MAG: (Fe-S)-binding protein [Candidatus Abyssobacteria bacterium SURF_5]|uniref:(Fe-S)-binding protein n=1 Tax=Abyssobacteria bacterium (strain SURF_5) TaxID=2093360 RepID=A0A3A4NU05_ABYX5|nr:MAG: (Fe-S)-binding protein [Candidatus Abyssubacteria bacterium SURF_5]
MDKKRLAARLNLARHFLQHTGRRLFASEQVDGAGVTEFLSKYAEDNTFQIDSRDRANYSSFAQCIQCSICQPYCVMFRVLNYLEFPGPMAVASTLSRAPDRFGGMNSVIYNCTMCRLCEITCPESAPIAAVVGFVRKYLYRHFPDLVPTTLKDACEMTRRSGTFFPQVAAMDRHREKESAEYVLFLGCHSRFDQQERVDAAVAMLNQMSVDFTMIDEVCCGAPLIAAGCDPGDQLAKLNIERIREKKTAKVITLCPHCLIQFCEGEEYAGKIEAIHIAELLPHMHPIKRGSEIIAYHDPCMLGRVAGIVNEPRQALEWAGATLVEMSTNRESSFCCGGWGGLTVTAPVTAEAIAAKRLEDARAVGADVLVTECPWCLSTLKSAGLSRKTPRVRSVIEYLYNPEF